MYEKITNIDPANESIKFIVKRISNKQYRGIHLSQHNRYDLNKIKTILTKLKKYNENNKLMQIRDTDISKRPLNTIDEHDYATFCDEIKHITGIGSQDAMRKNILVDLHRMGFVDRFDKLKNKIKPYAKSKIKYISISEMGKNFIDAENDLNKYFIYSKALNNLLSGHVEYLLELLIDNNLNNISIVEHMLFVSAIGVDCDYNITVQECFELIKSFRILGLRKNILIQTLTKLLKPENFLGDKSNKKDFHNWKNESQQLFKLLGETVYFENNENTEELILKLDEKGFADDNYIKLKRSLPEKQKYFIEHDIKKTAGFELHHVVPLAYAESREHFKILDTWINMIYIDAYSHAKITQNNNKNIFMKDANGNDIELDEIENSTSNQSVILKYDNNIKYDYSKKQDMLEQNKRLINTKSI